MNKTSEFENIAIVGMSCKFPDGVNSVEDYWDYIFSGKNVAGVIPPGRWENYSIKSDNKKNPDKFKGGFLSEVDTFDAGFFGISPREAKSIDPQQRLLLEVCWESLEHSGIALSKLKKNSVGVFIGLSSHEYSVMEGEEQFDGYSLTGNSASLASGRISHAFGFTGPSITVDTATSSSLVSLHLACQSVLSGESSLALAGGASLMLTPRMFIGFDHLGGLASDGLCKTFSAEADGTGWAEGCGMVVLKRLSDALRDGDRIAAVIRGTAVNHDGHTQGLTVPSGAAQEAVIRAALQQAGVRPADVGYVECHGTGTRLGDPIEVQALGAVLAEGRDAARPVILGSVKSNIGHTQAAAGIAGLIKTVLAMQHGTIPQNLHFATPNPHIPWDRLPVTVAAEATPWPRGDRPRIAGVSSWGLGGTNAHVILEEAPAADDAGRAAAPRAAQLLVLSGRTDAAVRGAAQRLAAHLRAHPEAELRDTAWSLATTRSHHEHRLALVADGHGAAAALLEQLARGELPGGTRGGVSTAATRAWLFTGQGSQRCGMGRELWAEWPAFREAFDAACAALDSELGGDLKAVMWGDDERLLAETGWTQPALFALQAGLAGLWRSWGVEPDFVAGHSLGELSAAYVAGVFTLEEAARLVAARGRLMQALPAGGSMAALNLPEAEVRGLTAGLPVSLAAVNGPSSVVISGESGAVQAAMEKCVAAGGRATALAVSHAFHSALMAPMLSAFRDVAESVVYRRPSVAVVSNVSGKLADEALCTAEYWVAHVMETVRFADGIATLAENGVSEFIELGPQGTLLGMAAEGLEEETVQLVASLQRQRGETQAVLEGLGALHVHGASLSWPGVFSGDERRVALPLYAWQRERYWIEARNAVTEITTGFPQREEEHTVDGTPRVKWDTGSESEQRGVLLGLIVAEAARILSLRSAEEIDSRQPLSERGMDSLMALELRRALTKKTGLTLPATLVFDYPSPQAIASFILQGKNVEKNSVPSSAEIDTSEPIAIVGMGCRYPGGIRNMHDFWQLLADGVDVIDEVPEERWDIDALYDPDPAVLGKITSRSGGFLSDIDQFDASFFGISPREAMNLDPQQRLLLETSWEALEDAGIPPHTIAESHTGVFFGLMPSEYAANTAVENFNGYIKTGSSPSIATGRLSYILGLKGPAITVDTACSSSLVSIHLACQSLRSHETSMALAGGATLNITPSMYLEFSRLRGLASDGRCKTFSDAADGTGWSEGSGVVVLKRLSDAMRDGDRIWAVLRGTAVNQDGRSNGLTAPNGPAQEAVIRAALQQAGVQPADVGYVECHGTGTRLGDPIEVQALGAVLAEGRDAARPVILGSVKSNIGHTQAAAGIAGLIKTVLAMQHGTIPQNLHFATPNPHIPWDRLPVTVAAEATPWPRGDRPRIAGVSSFGWSGTNAHVILEEAPAADDAGRAAAPRAAQLLVLSGRTDAAVRGAAQRLAAHLRAHPEAELRDTAWSLATTRSHHEHRLALVADGHGAAAALLEQLARGELPGGTRGGVSTAATRAWLFTGQGSQRCGMGRELWAEWPAFREAFDAACAALDSELGGDLKAVMWGDDERLLAETGWTQPALFALQAGLAALWRSWGVEPDFVAGHSLGELSAAYVAGVFTLKEAARLVAARGRLMQALPAGGSMAALNLPEAEVRGLTAGLPVSLAAVNGPSSVVISGESGAVQAAMEKCVAAGGRATALAVSHAFHSALMAPMLSAFRDVAESVVYRRPSVAVVSNVSGKLADEALCTAEYWVAHVMETVRFADGIATLAENGVSEFIELGPQGTLLGMAAEGLEEETVQLVASLQRQRGETQAVLEGLGALHVHGASLSWPGVFSGDERRVALPLYAWQRERYWIDALPQTLSGEDTGHPLLGSRISLAGEGAVFESFIAPGTHGWLYDHRVYELAVMPGAGVAEIMRAAGEAFFARSDILLSAIVLQSPLILAEAGQHIQVMIKDNDGQHELMVWSRAAQIAEWQLHATAEVDCSTLESQPSLDLAAIKARCGTESDIAELYQRFAESGLPYGPSFRGLAGVWSNQNEVLAKLKIPEEIGEVTDFGIHPILLDLAFQAYLSIDDSPILQLPFTIENFMLHERRMNEAVVYVKVSKFGDDHQSIDADVYVTDFSGKIIATALGMCIRQAAPPSKQQASSAKKNIYELQWQLALKSAALNPSHTRVALFGPYSRDSESLAAALAHASADVVTLSAIEEIVANPPDVLILHWDGESYHDEDSQYKEVLLSAIEAIRLLQSSGVTSKVVWLTRQAVKVSGQDQVDPIACALLTLGRALHKEFSNFPLYLIDADELSDNSHAVVNEILGTQGEDEVAIRGTSRFVPRLNVLAQEAHPAVSVADSSVLITGGLGAIGLNIAAWLAQQGACRIALVSRNIALNEEKKAKIAQIESYGAAVKLISADVADIVSIGQAIEQFSQEQALNGIIHAAGARNAQLLTEVTQESFAEVMSAKVDGAVHLDLLTRQRKLDFFILFSSVASTLSPEGQGVYAAANAFLDGLTDYRHTLGLPARSYAWGPWGEEGMVSDLDAQQSARLRNHGIDILTTADAAQLFSAAASCTPFKLILADLNIRAVKNYFREDIPAIWRSLIPVSEPRQQAAAGEDGLSAMSEGDRYSKILTLVRAESARVLSLAKADDIEKDQSLRDKGLDSLMALELRKGLGKKLGLTLPATLALDHPTPAALADFILSQLGSSQQSQSAAKDALILTSQPAVSKPPRSDVVLVPLSLGQERLWFMDKLGENKSLYNMSYGVRFSGELDAERLRACLALLVARHESLRTTFIDIPVYASGLHEARALIAPQGDVPLQVIDLSTAQDRQSQIERLAYTQRVQPFDISHGPLWRCLLITEQPHSHLLLLTQHHLITDAWSMVRLVKELVALYRSPQLPAGPQPAQPDYADYVRYQRHSLTGEAHRQSLAWWREKLKDLPRLALPIARNTLAPSHHGDAVRIDIGRALTAQVRRFSQQNSCTVFVTLLSAWATTLYRYSGQTDFGIGTLSAGRENSDFDEVQGFFVNILVLRPALSATMSFAQLASAMSLEVLESLRRQDTEFSEVAAGFTGSRSLDLNPLVQASFDFNSWPAAYQQDDFGCEWLDFVRGDAGVDGTAKFNLGLALLEKSDGIVGTLEFAVDLFERGSVENLAEQFLVLLDGATAQPAAELARLPMHIPDPQNEPVAAAGFDISRPVTQLIAQAARAFPQRTAVSCGDASLSYEAFMRETGRVARCLRAQGVAEGDVVGVYLDRSLLTLVSVVAIMQAGAVYLPLDVTYPAARLSYIVENAGCENIIAGPQAQQAAAWFSGRLLSTDGEGMQGGDGPLSGEALAYLIYTSGSTGQPKGVAVPHSCLTNLILHYADSLAVSEADRLLGVTPFSFDISILEIFLPLVCGAELRLLGREQSRNAEELLRETARATLMQATPATWHLLTEAGWEGNPRLKALCGGEALTLTLAQALAARTREAWNCYGPTETTIWSAAWRIDPARGSVTIGDAIANTQLYVLDDNMQPVAKGIPGELYIGGSGVAAGYVNAPELTAQRFIPSPFAGGGRLYRTGDRVRRGHDGLIEYIERIDFQLKINGYRVEVSEIEAVLEQHPKVSRSAVVPVTQGGDTRLVCFYIAAGEEAGEWELYDFLKGSLPEYMLPSVYRALAEFPLSGSGKVDRKALAALPLSEGTAAVSDNGGEAEAAMVAIWEAILGSKVSDRRRSFFELGGNSLKLLLLQKRVQQTFGKNITIAELFKYPSVRELCTYLTKDPAAIEKTLSVQIDGRNEDKALTSEINRINNYEESETKRALADILNGLNQEDEF